MLDLANSLSGKIVVADTSSLLIDGTGLIDVLPDCTLVIPTIVVKELETKRSDPYVGIYARQWMNLLEDLRVECMGELTKGVLVPDAHVHIWIEPNHTSQSVLPAHLADGSNDSTILAVAKQINDEESRDVVLLSNDTPMRLHATISLGLEAYEFSVSQTRQVGRFTGIFDIDVSDETLADLMSDEYAWDSLADEVDTDASHYVIRVLSNGDPVEHVLISPDGVELLPKSRPTVSGIMSANTEQTIAMKYLQDTSIQIVSISGTAGTGKTLCTMAVAARDVCSKYDKVVVFRSLHEMGRGQELGFLPGSVDEKMAPWSGAIDDALSLVKMHESRKDLFTVEPITYLRGRSLANTLIVLDEAQNFSRGELLGIISRTGLGSKIVLLFDDAQVDNRFLRTGKHADVWSVVNDMKFSDMFAHVSLQHTERSLVAELAASLL